MRPLSNKPNLVAFVALLILGVVWGLSIILTKHIMTSTYAPIGLIFWQLVIGAVLLSGLCILQNKPLPRSQQAITFYFWVAIIGTIVPNSASYLAATQLPAGLIAIGLATVPMFALLIALLIGNEKPVLRRLLGIGLGVVAMLLLLGPDVALPDKGLTLFILLAFVAPFFYGVEGNYIARAIPAGMDAITTLRGSSIVGDMLCLPIVWLTDTWVDLAVVWTSIEWALLLNSVLHVLTYTGYIWLVARAGAVFASQVAYIVTLSGVMLGILLLQESHHWLVWLSLCLMLLGLSLVQPKER